MTDIKKIVPVGDQQVGGEKPISIKFVGGNRPQETLGITPGTTAGEILQSLGLDPFNFVLSRGGAGTSFGSDEDVYGQLNEGDTLYVGSTVDAGR